mgnify:CR=1 FL=1
MPYITTKEDAPWDSGTERRYPLGKRSNLDGWGLRGLKIKQKAAWEKELSLVRGGASPHPSEAATNDMMNMVRILSHDIRGPLVSTGAAVKLIRRGAYGAIDEAVGRELDKILVTVQGSIGILEDFLGKSFVTNGGLVIMRESLQLNEDVLLPVLNEISADLKSHEVSFHNGMVYKSEQDLTIQGNRFWLKAVFRNLLKNAIAYGGRGCMVAVGVRDEGDRLRLNVYNTGKTVPREDREKLFSKFSQITCANKGAGGGMGLGLYLVKDIVERHGGEIAYEAGRYGSNFVFTLSKG